MLTSQTRYHCVSVLVPHAWVLLIMVPAWWLYILGICICRILPRAENKIENKYSPAALETSKYTQALPRHVHCPLIAPYTSSCTGRAHTSAPTHRGNGHRGIVVIERNESYLLLSPIGIITNCPFNCDGLTNKRMDTHIAASDAQLVASC